MGLPADSCLRCGGQVKGGKVQVKKGLLGYQRQLKTLSPLSRGADVSEHNGHKETSMPPNKLDIICHLNWVLAGKRDIGRKSNDRWHIQTITFFTNNCKFREVIKHNK